MVEQFERGSQMIPPIRERNGIYQFCSKTKTPGGLDHVYLALNNEIFESAQSLINLLNSCIVLVILDPPLFSYENKWH